VIDRFILYCSTGPVLHLRTACTATEHFDRSR
jgi:hypothetical protein